MREADKERRTKISIERGQVESEKGYVKNPEARLTCGASCPMNSVRAGTYVRTISTRQQIRKNSDDSSDDHKDGNRDDSSDDNSDSDNNSDDYKDDVTVMMLQL